MAKLAELEFQDKQLQQAMVWAQMYTRYLRPNKPPRSRHGRRYAYPSSLIKRITDANGNVDKNKVMHDVNAMVARYDTSIRDGIQAFKSEHRSGDPHLISWPYVSVPKDKLTLSGVAEFMVAFDPAGKPGKVWQLVSFPTSGIADVLHPSLEQARVNPVAADSGTRYLLIPLTLQGAGTKEVRAKHDYVH